MRKAVAEAEAEAPRAASKRARTAYATGAGADVPADAVARTEAEVLAAELARPAPAVRSLDRLSAVADCRPCLCEHVLGR